MTETILLPSQLKIVSEENNTGVYEIEGLYPGYGHTLGNSLRRIILSSLPGAAITSLKIDGVQHEFSTIDGVKEDVLTIILHMKKVRFKLLTDEAQTVRLHVSGPKVVTAADIDASGQVEVLNPDEYIAELTTKKGKLDIEIKIEQGLGFVAKKVNKKEKVDIGEVGVDAIFTPIRKVHYEVENMRVGDRTDHNRLRMTIQTDGTLTPREALEESIMIMITQLKAVIDLKEDLERVIPLPSLAESIDAGMVPDSPNAELAQQEYADVLKTRIDTLDLTTRTLNALSEASIRTIGGLAKKTESELLALDGIGAKGLDEIKDMLATFDITLKP